MAYKIKRGSVSADQTIKNMLMDFLKRLSGTILILALIAVACYLLFRFAYQFPPFAEAADDVIGWLKVFYRENGVWATLGLIAFVCVGVWMLGEESRRKDDRDRR